MSVEPYARPGGLLPKGANSGRVAEGNILALPSAILALTTLTATASGFIREAAIAYRFGTSALADAFSLMVYFVDVANVMAGTAIGSFAFVPVLSLYKSRRTPERGWNLVTAFSTWILLVCVLLLAGIMAFPERTVQVLYPGFSSTQQELTTGLFRLAMPALLLAICGALISGALQADYRFNVGNAGRIVFNLGLVIGIIVLYRPFGELAFSASFYVGAALGLLVQGWNLRGAGYHPSMAKLTDRELWPVLGLAIPGLLALGLMNVLLGSAERFLLSGLPEGSIAATGYGQRLMMMVGGISLAIQTVAFRSMAQDPESAGTTRTTAFSTSVEMGTFALLPLSLFLFAYAPAIVTVVFRGGLFDEVSSLLTARATRWYALSVVPGFILGVSVRACYAFFSPGLSIWMTAVLTLSAVGIDLLLLGTLGFEAIPVGFLGGMLCAGAVGLGVSSRKGWVAGLPRVLSGLLKDGFVAVAGIALVRGVWPVMAGASVAGRGQALAELTLAAAVYGALYLAGSAALGREPARGVWKAAMRSAARLGIERWHIH